MKLWEKCEIAKVAVKRGVQNTNSELMAEELKVCEFILAFDDIFFFPLYNTWLSYESKLYFVKLILLWFTKK